MGLGWPAAIALFPLVGLAVEGVLLRLRWRPYFRAGFPLHLELVPIARRPEGEGGAGSVRWAAGADGLVTWWAVAPDGLTGLHGVVRCAPTRRGVALHLRWSPPWSPLLAAVGLAGLGFARGLPHVTLPVAAALVIGLVLVYHQGALRAASELRWSFVRDAGGGDA